MPHRIALFLLLFFCTISSHAQRPALSDDVIPDDLKPWKDWVLHNNEHIKCPYLYDDEVTTCVWVSATNLQADEQSLRFSMTVEAFAPITLSLPGNHRYWPTQVYRRSKGVKTETAALPVAGSNSKPEVFLSAGKHTVTGLIPWARMPSNLPLPGNIGLIQLSLNGQLVANPEVDRAGQLWLRKHQISETTKVRDSEKLYVFRRVHDANPATVLTRVILEVSGQPREIQAGQFLLDNFEPLHLKSELPARIEKNGDLRIQVKPGRWQIDMLARVKGELNELSYNKNSELWPAQEFWSFEAVRALRAVQIEGVSSIDPSQTSLPRSWHNLPAYRVTPEQTMGFKLLYRGDPSPEADDLALERHMYLDFDGSGFTINDRIIGQVKQSWRLDSHADYVLGSARLNNQPQLITRSADGNSQGLELRDQRLDVEGLSRFGLGSLPYHVGMQASGWQQNFNSVSARLHLPPGWSLLASAGVDQVERSWLSSWNLWDIFLVLIICVACFKICGILPGILALLTMVLLYHRPDAPVFIWLSLVALVALLNVTDGKLHRWLRYYQMLSFLALVLLFLPFSIQQVREAIHPQLEHPYYSVGSGGEMESNNGSFETEVRAQAVRSRSQKDTRARAPLMMSADSVEEVVVTGIRQSVSEEDDYLQEKVASRLVQSREPPALRKQNSAKREYDPNAIIQTGPGLPQWEWNSVRLNWSGPVAADEQLDLYLVPPWLNRIGNILTVILGLLFAGLLIVRSGFGSLPTNSKLAAIFLGRGFKNLASKSMVLGLIVPVGMALGFGYTDQAQATVVIDNEILEELEERLTAPPICLPDCATIEQVNLIAEPDKLNINISFDVQDDIAVGLPAWHMRWLPDTVTQNGRTATIKLGRGGQLFIQLSRGRHQIRMQGRLHKELIELDFGMPVHNFTSSVDGWDLTGVQKGGAGDGQVKTKTLQLRRTQALRDDASNTLSADPITPFVQLSRQINLGLEWRVSTTVYRVAPARGAFTLKIPLLKGESPISELEQDKGEVTVVFAPDQQILRWDSVLDKQDAIELVAALQFNWSEHWRVQASTVWHLDLEGIAPIKSDGALHSPRWQPWPGERVTIAVSRPEAVNGESLTIDSVKLQHTLGLRSNSSEMQFKIRSSQGQDFPLRLPENAVFESLHIDGRAQSVSHSDNLIKIPVHPGEQTIQVNWRNAEGITWFASLPSIDLARPSSNVRLAIELPRNRWPLFVGGPALGPAVLIWGYVLVMLVMAFFLGKSELTPLRFHHWVLLSLGVFTANVAIVIGIVIGFFLVGLRGRLKIALKLRQFKLMQVLLLMFSGLTLLLLLSNIPAGLLSSPDMHIVGNASNGQYLNWYQDRSEAQLPSAWVVSLPMYVYRLAMLAWSLWLAFALMSWLKWGWQQLNVGGFWREYAFVKVELKVGDDGAEADDGKGKDGDKSAS
ncbi:MAG: hypothetical protein COA42_04860 [Alteromonadaceae bacterium]|nr:MAG: hypothetical protein COA42_04860 [Alteromonadaceae bacterium]